MHTDIQLSADKHRAGDIMFCLAGNHRYPEPLDEPPPDVEPIPPELPQPEPPPSDPVPGQAPIKARVRLDPIWRGSAHPFNKLARTRPAQH